MHGLRGLVIFTALLMLSTYVIPLLGATNYLLYIYGSEGCPHCSALKNYFNSWYGSTNFYFCSFELNSSCAERLIKFCSDLGISPSIPLTFVVVDGSIRAVVFGEVGNKSFWDALLKIPESTDVPLYLGSQLGGYIRVTNLSKFSEFMVPEYYGLRPGGDSVPALPLPQALALLTTLALSDAVNPCVIFIYILLLVAATLAFGRGGKTFLIGLSFILAVFLGYYVLGIGLMTVVRGLPKEFLSVIAIGFGIWVIVSSIMGKSRILAKDSVLGLIGRASSSTTSSFALGLLLTFTLLPCSAGPYVVFAGVASKYGAPLQYLLLAIYNLIFISPLLLVFAVTLKTMRYKSVQDVLKRYGVKLSLIAGLLLIAVGVWVLFI
ncbi:MAG: hypothetical protein N3G48_05555 [Sulfolobales archaeon]|nr:hypothetical protein [Sulfolobales archaeon]